MSRTRVDVDAWRGEGKVTATVAPAHTVQGGFFTNPREERYRPAFSNAIDPATLTTQKTPELVRLRQLPRRALAAAARRGAVHRTTVALEWGAGVSDALNDSPIFGPTRPRPLYNGPYFDPNDPEERNNRQFTGSATYVDRWRRPPRIKGGYEWFRSQNTGGNSQSTSGYVFDADYLTDDDGDAVLDAHGRLIPVFRRSMISLTTRCRRHCWKRGLRHRAPC